MADEAISFRLLDLKESIGTVLKCMGVLDLISFSLCSKKMAATVKSLNIPITQFQVNIDDKFSVRLKVQDADVYLWFRQEGYSRELEVTYVEGYIQGRHRAASSYKRWNEPISGNGWLRHLMEIFNQEKINVVFNFDRIELDSILTIVKDLKISCLVINYIPGEYTAMILRRFNTVENVEVDNILLHDTSGDAILLNNYHNLRIRGSYPKLDHLSTINCFHFKSYANMSSKELSRFLKLWLSGSNPRLRRCEFDFLPNEIGMDRFEGTLQEDAVMRGITFHRISQDTDREFSMNGVVETIQGGLDFMKKNGTKATVKIENRDEDEDSIFQMFVWL